MTAGIKALDFQGANLILSARRYQVIDRLQIDVDSGKLVKFCQRHHIKKLAFFGSVLRDDFRSDSDVDVLVEFEKEHVPGLIRLSGMEIELSELLGRKADLNTPGFFNPPMRKRILAKAKVQYAA